MKKLLFFVGVMGLVGCNTYTVKNETAGPVEISGKELKAGACVELSDSFFGLFGDFPVTITGKDKTELSDKAKKDAEYDVNNYVVKADKSVSEVEEEEACEEAKEEEEADETATDAATPTTDVDAATTPGADAATTDATPGADKSGS